MVVNAGLIEEERTMSALLPVARMARPSRVRRKKLRKTITSATATSSTISLYCAPRGLFFRASLVRLNTVAVLFMFNWALLPVMAMFTEYRPVLTTMPASRLCTPMRVCSTAVTKPLRLPASMAAGMDSQGWPLRATMAPTAAPRVKQPSVDRSHTFSME